MAEIDFEKLATMMSNPATAKTADSVGGMLNSGNDILKQGDAILNLLDKVAGFIERLEHSPALSTAIRIGAKNSGVTDFSPLRQPEVRIVEVGIRPKSPLHEQIFNQMNQIGEEQLKVQMESYAKQLTIGQPDNK